MKTYSYEETFGTTDQPLTEAEMRLVRGRKCNLTNQMLEAGDKVTRVLLPEISEDGLETITYIDAIVKTEEIKVFCPFRKSSLLSTSLVVIVNIS